MSRVTGRTGSLPSSSGLEIASQPPVERCGVQEVTLLSVGNVDFERFVLGVHSLWESSVLAQGGQMLITSEEFLRLFITAVDSRVQHTRLKNTFQTQGKFIHPKSFGPVPTQFAYVANAVGTVLYTDGLTIVPVMDVVTRQKVMDQDEMRDLGARMRGYEPLGCAFVTALSGEVTGDDTIMQIFPYVSANGEITYGSYIPVTGPGFLTGSLLGREAMIWPDGTPKFALPLYTVGATRLLTWLPQYSASSSAKVS